MNNKCEEEIILWMIEWFIILRWFIKFMKVMLIELLEKLVFFIIGCNIY